jgi:hypothetical protein
MCGQILTRAKRLNIFHAVDGDGGVRYGLFWRGEPLTAESSAEAEDPMNLIQVMLAKGNESFWISPLFFHVNL